MFKLFHEKIFTLECLNKIWHSSYMKYPQRKKTKSATSFLNSPQLDSTTRSGIKTRNSSICSLKKEEKLWVKVFFSFSLTLFLVIYYFHNLYTHSFMIVIEEMLTSKRKKKCSRFSFQFTLTNYARTNCGTRNE